MSVALCVSLSLSRSLSLSLVDRRKASSSSFIALTKSLATQSTTGEGGGRGACKGSQRGRATANCTSRSCTYVLTYRYGSTATTRRTDGREVRMSWPRRRARDHGVPEFLGRREAASGRRTEHQRSASCPGRYPVRARPGPGGQQLWLQGRVVGQQGSRAGEGERKRRRRWFPLRPGTRPTGPRYFQWGHP